MSTTPINKRIIRVFPERTRMTPADGLAFIGDPIFPEFLPIADEVHVSVTFTWHLEEGRRLQKAWSHLTGMPTLIGGPALGDPGAEFEPGLYVKKGVVITTRGCPRRCKWCFVPRREGKLRLLKIRDGSNILDNNLLAAPRSHIEAVFKMLGTQRKPAIFSGGLDSRLIDDWIVEKLKDTRIDTLFLAYDDESNRESLTEAAQKLSFLGLEKLKAYVLMGYSGDSLEKAEKRCRDVFKLGMMPFAMYFRDVDGKEPSPLWAEFVRDWIRPPIIKSRMGYRGKQTHDNV